LVQTIITEELEYRDKTINSEKFDTFL